ncbi:GGDEF domain-containing protein [Parvularcula sp. IMCC14364]|uniref:GGDEF domain-containing protein n=1 Tax=Parvularcula sp. IMCC14364 TaxID=3067902 RepID=UPI00274203FB|nr:GGDEF domain-containing protein [Parvularcula sp. IMCC14364]
MTEENQKQNSKATKEYKKASEIAEKAFTYIEEHQTPAYPSTYAFWYSYAARSDEDMVRTVDETLEKTGSLSVYDINQLHDKFLSADEAEKRQSEKIGNDFEKEMVSVMRLVQQGMSSSDSYCSSLDAAQEQLPDAVSPDKIAEIVTSLIAQNQEMREMTETLNSGLQKSQSQIHELNAQLAKARDESMRDGLTKLANRRSFDISLAREIATARENGTDLTLVLADIDHFKRVNDTYGHQVGDGILQTFASLISNNVKGRDIAARYGGEEFALILPQTNMQSAFHLVEKIRKDLESSKLVIKSTGQCVGKVTSSFGMSMLQDGFEAETLIQRADAKLYDAKNNGRNRIEMDSRKSEAA